jgi:hypothetical protein
VFTAQRQYVLLSASEDERSLWVFAFQWIIDEQLRVKNHKKEVEETAEKFKKLSI